jgi:hypothetical protein
MSFGNQLLSRTVFLLNLAMIIELQVFSVGLQLGREYTGVESNKDGVSTNIFFIKR